MIFVRQNLAVAEIYCGSTVNADNFSVACRVNREGFCGDTRDCERCASCAAGRRRNYRGVGEVCVEFNSLADYANHCDVFSVNRGEFATVIRRVDHGRAGINRIDERRIGSSVSINRNDTGHSLFDSRRISKLVKTNAAVNRIFNECVAVFVSAGNQADSRLYISAAFAFGRNEHKLFANFNVANCRAVRACRHVDAVIIFRRNDNRIGISRRNHVVIIFVSVE